MFSFTLGKHVAVKCLGHLVMKFNFLRNCQFPKTNLQVYIPTSSMYEFRTIPYPQQDVKQSIFLNRNYSNGYIMMTPWGFNLHFTDKL